MLLYTDGLIETRGGDIDAGQQRLRQTLSVHYHLGPGELLDAVLADMLDSPPRDDVAVLAVRLHPDDATPPPSGHPHRMSDTPQP